MYSEKIIVASLAEFARQEKWEPVYHTLEQVQEFTEYINKIAEWKNNWVNITRKVTAKNAAAIRRWVENEQVLCMFDNGYFESRYCYVCDEKGDIFKFANRLGQTVLDNVTAEAEEAHRANELLVVKARQEGITTKVAMMFVQAILFTPHTQAVMGSVIEQKSELINRIIETCIARLPWWLIPDRTTDKKNMIAFKNGSIMSIQSGNQATGIAQGWTPTRVHISEIGDIPNPKKSIEEGLLHATHSTHKLSLVLEGTGNGNTGWLADKWRSAKEKWPLGMSRLRPIFIPWPMTPELFPTADFIHDHPVPAGFKPFEITRKHVQRCELFIRSTDYLTKVVGKNWRMPIEQQWYWQWNYLQTVDSHTQKVWFAQKPADDYEALQGKNDMVFDGIVLDTAREQKQPYQAYAITGDSIDDGFEPDESDIDYDKERLRVTWRSHRGQRYDWTMVPLLPFPEGDERRAFDKVLIFEEPNSRPGHEGEPEDYSIGIDTADGLGNDDEDRTALIILRSMKHDLPDMQVAELCSNRMNGPQLVGFAACLAAYYGENTNDARGVKFAIEQRDRPGDDCQMQLKLMGFSHHHVPVRYDNKKLNERDGTTKQGIFMHGYVRQQIMGRFVEAVNGSWLVPRSPFLIQELSNLERKIATSGKSRMEHQAGKHDDRVLATAHAYWTYHAFDVLAQRAQLRYAPPVSKKPELDLSWCTAAEISVGDMV